MTNEYFFENGKLLDGELTMEETKNILHDINTYFHHTEPTVIAIVVPQDLENMKRR